MFKSIRTRGETLATQVRNSISLLIDEVAEIRTSLAALEEKAATVTKERNELQVQLEKAQREIAVRTNVETLKVRQTLQRENSHLLSQLNDFKKMAENLNSIINHMHDI